MSRPCSSPALVRRLWTAAVLLLAAACRDSTPAVVAELEVGPLIADAGALSVIDDSAPSWGAESRWTVGDTPTLDLGDPDQPFLGVPPVLSLSDGRIVVADGSRQTIRYFDRTGRLLTAAGGRADDDGEFHGLGWIGRGAADSLVAYDFVARRMAILDPRGKIVRFAKLQPADPTPDAEPMASFADGTVLFRLGGAPNPFPGAPGTLLQDSAAYLRFDLDGLPVAALGVFPQQQVFGVQVRPGANPAPFPVPFGLTTSAAVRGDSMLIGTGASFEILSVGPEGTPGSLLRAAIPREAITPAEVEAFTAAALTRLRTNAFEMSMTLDSGFVRAIQRAPFPARKPAFGRLLVDRTGTLWVSEPINPPDEPTRWNVFTAAGEWLGSVTTPAGLRIDEIGSDYLLGVWKQVHGKERVRRYPLSRGGA